MSLNSSQGVISGKEDNPIDLILDRTTKIVRRPRVKH